MRSLILLFALLLASPAVAAVDDVTTLDVVNAGTFTRNGLAYEFDGTVMQARAANTRRTKAVESCSEVTGSRLDSTSNKAIFSYTGSVFVACGNQSTTEQAKLYTSPDASTWTLAKTFSYAVSFVWKLYDGRHVALVSNGSGAYLLFRQDTVGDLANWTQCTLVGAATVAANSVAWSFHQRAIRTGESAPTVCLSKYGAVTDAPQIWQSKDNGLTWTLRFALHAYDVDHFHSICYQEAIHRWVVDTGDMAAVPKQYTFYSDDDGDTWQSWQFKTAFSFTCASPYTTIVSADSPFRSDMYSTTSNGRLVYLSGTGITSGYYRINGYTDATTVSVTPACVASGSDPVAGTGKVLCVSATGNCTRFLDYGHATRLLVASDWYQRLGWVDASSWARGNLQSEHAGIGTEGYNPIFLMFKHDGLYYAGSESQMISWSSLFEARTPCMYVSADLSHWVLAHRVAVGQTLSFYQFAGEYAGELYFTTKAYISGTSDQGWGSYKITKPVVATLNGIALAPAKSNLLFSRGARANSATNWSGTAVATSADVMTVTGGPIADLGTIHDAAAFPSIASGSNLTAPSVSTGRLTADKTYVAHAWLKGRGRSTTSWMYNGTSAGRELGRFIPSTVWTEIFGGSHILLKSTNLTQAWSMRREPSDDATEIWVACSEVNEAPISDTWAPTSFAGTISTATYSAPSTTIVGSMTTSYDFDVSATGQELVCSVTGNAYRITSYTSANTVVVSGDAHSESGAFYTRQAPEKLSFAQTFPTDFTHVFGAEIVPSTYELGRNRQYLMCYKVDANEYVYLYLENAPADANTYADWEIKSGDGYKKAYSASFPFALAEVGKTFRLSGYVADGGRPLPVGWYKIVAVGADNVSIDAAAGLAGTTNLTGQVYNCVFGLETVTSGAASGTPITTAHRILYRHQMAKIAVRCSGQTFRLSVMDGNGIEHVATALTRTGTALGGVTGTIQTGDASGNNVLPMTLFDSHLYRNALSNTAIEARLSSYPTFTAADRVVPKAKEIRYDN